MAWFQFDRRIIQEFNFILLLQIIPILVLSSILMYEMSAFLFRKQMIYYSIGFVTFIFVFLIPWKKYLWLIPLMYWISLILLFLVEFIGIEIGGAKRWIKIPIINFTLQPSEFIKITVLLMLGYLISKNPPDNKYGFKDFTKLSIYILIPTYLIYREPDLGTALVLCMTGFGILFIIGVKWRVWITLFLLIIISFPIYYKHFMKPYQKQRIASFIGKSSYQVRQSLIAIGSGGTYGQKEIDATQTKLHFLPVSSTDFIFAYLGERFGFVGIISLILLYIFLILHLLYISLSKDYFVKVFATGMAFLFFIYMDVNISMTIGLAPVVGMPLPMFSHGGSSLILFFILFAILENLISFRYYEKYNLYYYQRS